MNNAVGFILVNFVWFAQLIGSLATRKPWLDLARGDAFAIWAVMGAAGIFTFVIAVFLTTARSNYRPYLVLASALLSIIVVGFAGAFRGKLTHFQIDDLLLGLSGSQIAIALGALYWARDGRIATLLMLPLLASFWLWSSLDAAMSFQDVWL